MSTEVLEQSERALLSTYESIVKKNKDAFIETGTALMRIRDGRLYRETHKSFADYCSKKWEFSKTHVNRLIDASEVHEDLTPIGVMPKSESQIRPLSQLPPADRDDAWKEAVETAPRDKSGKPKVTAKHVAEVVEKRTGKESPKAKQKEDEVRYRENPAHSLSLVKEAEQAFSDACDEECDEASEVFEAFEKLKQLIVYYIRVTEK